MNIAEQKYVSGIEPRLQTMTSLGSGYYNDQMLILSYRGKTRKKRCLSFQIDERQDRRDVFFSYRRKKIKKRYLSFHTEERQERRDVHLFRQTRDKTE
jgi:hypothetical protein